MNSNKMLDVTRHHAEKFGRPRVIRRGAYYISNDAFRQQYSIVYDDLYEYTRGRKVRFSSMRNEMYEI